MRIKTIIVILVLGALAYLRWGPYFKAIPVSQPNITFPSSQPQQATSPEENILAGPAADVVATAPACRGHFNSPPAGQTYKIRTPQTISWQMPGRDTYYFVSINILDAKNVDLGSVINWNWVKYDATKSAFWDAGVRYNSPADNSNIFFSATTTIPAGTYKLKLHYTYTDTGVDPLENCAEGSFESPYFQLAN